jgi:hypothetical protein
MFPLASASGAAPCGGSLELSTGSLSSTAIAASPAPDKIVLTLGRATGLLPDLVTPLLVGALFAGLVTLTLARRYPRGSIKAASSWNFKDSLATNLTAIGAALGTVAAIAGPTSALFPGIQMSSFALLSAFWGGLALSAPIVLGLVDHTPPDPDPVNPPTAAQALPGTYVDARLLAIATFITLLAVGAEVTTAGRLVLLASTTGLVRVLFFCLLVGTLLLVGRYVHVTVRTLLATQDDVQGPRSSLNPYHATSLTV